MEHRLPGELFAKLVALDHLAVLLTLGEVEDDLLAIHIQLAILPLLDLHLAAAGVRFDGGTVKRELGRGREIDDDGLSDSRLGRLLARQELLAQRLEELLDEAFLPLADDPRQQLDPNAHLHERVAHQREQVDHHREEIAQRLPVRLLLLHNAPYCRLIIRVSERRLGKAMVVNVPNLTL